MGVRGPGNYLQCCRIQRCLVVFTRSRTPLHWNGIVGGRGQCPCHQPIAGSFATRLSILQQCRQASLPLLDQIKKYRLSHIPRALNQAADSLANNAIDAKLPYGSLSTTTLLEIRMEAWPGRNPPKAVTAAARNEELPQPQQNMGVCLDQNDRNNSFTVGSVPSIAVGRFFFALDR